LDELSGLPGKVTLTTDPKLDKIDKYGRSLRYVFIGKINLNLKLIEMGAATPYFYRSEKGIYATQFLKAAQNAQKLGLGLWRTCPGTRLSPNYAVNTRA
jgi:micrococcal nuclease